MEAVIARVNRTSALWQQFGVPVRRRSSSTRDGERPLLRGAAASTTCTRASSAAASSYFTITLEYGPDHDQHRSVRRLASAASRRPTPSAPARAATCTRSCGTTGAATLVAEHHVTENLENEWTGRRCTASRSQAFFARELAIRGDRMTAEIHMRWRSRCASWRQEARERLDPAVYDFFAGGADDEITLRANEAAFARIGLVPRVLRGGGAPELDVELLGRRLVDAGRWSRRPRSTASRIPTASARRRAPAAAAGTVMIASMASTVAIEEIVRPRATAPTAGAVVPALHPARPRLHRGASSGAPRRPAARALVVTRGLAGLRPPRAGPAQRLPRPARRAVLREHARAGDGAGRGRVRRSRRTSSWAHIDWLRERTSLPIAAQGHRCTRTTRGSRSSTASTRSSSPTTAAASSTASRRAVDLLPAIADGRRRRGARCCSTAGVRRGTDVVKALRARRDTRSASAGRCCGGSPSTASRAWRHVLELLRAELDARADAVRLRLRCARSGRELVRARWTRAEEPWLTLSRVPPRARWRCEPARTGCRAPSSRCGCGSSRASTATRASRSPGDVVDAAHFKRGVRAPGRERPQPRRGAVGPVLVLAVAGARAPPGAPRARRALRRGRAHHAPHPRAAAARPAEELAAGCAARRARRAAGRAAAAGPAARPGDADLGRVLLRARVRRACPRARAPS